MEEGRKVRNTRKKKERGGREEEGKGRRGTQNRESEEIFINSGTSQLLSMF
jgi:hypothetical protein